MSLHWNYQFYLNCRVSPALLTTATQGSHFRIFSFLSICILFIRTFLFYWSQRERKGERKRGRKMLKWGRNQSACTPTRDRTLSPGMCPGREPSSQPFGLQDNAEQTEPHWPGILLSILKILFVMCSIGKMLELLPQTPAAHSVLEWPSYLDCISASRCFQTHTHEGRGRFRWEAIFPPLNSLTLSHTINRTLRQPLEVCYLFFSRTLPNAVWEIQFVATAMATFLLQKERIWQWKCNTNVFTNTPR